MTNFAPEERKRTIEETETTPPMPARSSKEGVKEITYALAVTSATLEATADGILAIDEMGGIISWNAKFLELWAIPQDLISLREAERIRAWIARQLIAPEEYLNRIAEIEASAECVNDECLHLFGLLKQERRADLPFQSDGDRNHSRTSCSF